MTHVLEHRSSPQLYVTYVIELLKAGADCSLAQSEATYRAVTGNITVPTPKPLFDESGSYSAALSVSIDGDNCESALFLVIDVNSQGGQASYDGAALPSSHHTCFLLMIRLLSQLGSSGTQAPPSALKSRSMLAIRSVSLS